MNDPLGENVVEENNVSISFFTITYNEENCIEDCIKSVLPIVQEVIVVDTGSTDNTVDIVKKMGEIYKTTLFRLYQMPELHRFDEYKTIASHLTRGEWVLHLDADERIDLLDIRWIPLLACTKRHDAWKFPRKRWADLEKRQQLEKEAYPDWQVRLYKNNPSFRWVGALHESLKGPKNKGESEKVTIHHFTDYFHLSDPIRREWRKQQREKLAALAGVPVEGSEEASRLAGFSPSPSP